MKILVIGAPGSGKTSLVEYAREQGYDNFFDTDDIKGLCEWREYATGMVIGDVNTVEPVGGETWYKTNGWYWLPSKIDELLNSTDNPIVCGSADNVMDFYGHFDRVVLLYKSREDIVHNLLQPGRKQANGKDPKHHDRILKWQEKLLESSRSYDPLLITENNTSTVFKKIIEAIK